MIDTRPILKPRTMADILNDWGVLDDGFDDILSESNAEEVYDLALTSRDMILGRY
ncbi:MAG TPA: hypothetical protein V6D05_01805 [Stenomitos sp.]